MIRHIVCLLLLLPVLAAAQPRYTAQDSARAKAYFKQSWGYPLNSLAHQRYIDSALQILPQHSWYWQQRSMPLYKAHKVQLAKPFLDSAVKYDPDRWLEYRAFMECIYERDYHLALTDLRAATQRYGDRVVMDHYYGFYIGLCHLQLNNYDSAARYIQGCLDTDVRVKGAGNEHYNHLFYRGIVHIEQGQFDAAIRCFDRAMHDYPNYSDAQYYKAICLYRLGRKKEALPLAEAALANFEKGYTLNEDNSIYEDYPYQLRRYMLPATIDMLKEELAGKP